ncbi:1-(5-phosphoribosyl)-5-[(5-phosphoribosylamino)methylideneamino] imidazole-4-carboxamide isomerase [Dethiosulfatibacter aminovorans DSM 17477]|uniref:1-(5-phosphoribosyl)-5-[(5-phosphoribosylamino)methylideneamino] imidazole-4-carboxamide isomerase n=1 Tax=Dethiosulfatibacter aminovorans DSM 17477 TaxID=1121476 RepID=A0A1M6H3L5_9FIRM|nr:1-(5-phosphoribosyl)-5-[(5-phosphoribosylamino)methylideneamino]imidazole-4-carboxamide isomerase [Dethiosulfatibacter aminovorans]SHJ16788.1 1-(5-phosphoribosyl)-5-[(5-phosphoribosylamino)methylideneamino] imidazole-4-carboxamide isomerase [Dethiosulfatibacter aminovorans DSM 17477]
MILLPAIDIKNNKCVRLIQGDLENATIYSDNPVEMALKWQNEGAQYLHVVDLDGAQSVSLVNRESIREIIRSISVPIEIGGGIRTEERIEELLDLGVSRIVLSTIAVENQNLLRRFSEKYAKYLAVSVDAVNGKAAVRGWKDVTSVDVMDICSLMEECGIKTLIYTDILRGGMLRGPNFEVYEKLKKSTKLDIIASGGVSSLEDVKRLEKLDMYGAIIGRALCDGTLDFKEAIKCLQGE